jgi:large subunit ribosomal protein L21
MHAVIKTGGKQYRVAEGDVLQIETISGEPGDAVSFDEVLAVGDGADMKVGTPVVEGAKVDAEVVDQTRGDKIIVFKKKRRQNYRRRTGHRQNLTVVRVTGITAG